MQVGVRKLSSVNPGTYPALQGGKKRIVVLRTSGAIVGKCLDGTTSSTSSSNGQDDVFTHALDLIMVACYQAGLQIR